MALRGNTSPPGRTRFSTGGIRRLAVETRPWTIRIKDASRCLAFCIGPNGKEQGSSPTTNTWQAANVDLNHVVRALWAALAGGLLMAGQNLRVQRPIPFPISLRPAEGPDQMAGNPLLIPQDAIEPPLAQFLDAEHREGSGGQGRGGYST
ncbi:hypothetical protein N5P37_007133 [Trichoderma harzianum]|uniref:Uncharacterized protein n=1 Tax=Trichoderma harzianum CBS 226.95 TaxID=983964 RepID=A0A2T4AKI6_TRIHA|nr:hypothetical protein M431DRAFT_479068 [Trichoderma harzianum CBS 226.95]KAK0760054.1 hypothetical protein N5P37_007133 [Trichoderma harzianum]PTB57458.1 hypothetical protein M431DRAFT_479068 [Trichoderma harzianum CBS 226.95]